ncbi:nuclear transport factor 2 family protein [Erwinia tracheiphila]|uniref:Transcriptional regulator n=1 Tax=Erwinia tracheiphila TaxID=65700 RepID=A0A0M2KCR2_9GAMM|nr:nuclear transport factor 2 family protein [Erwinia tracheiphila]EOS96462.1 transcriptional regulator [Erwinia tracheiphila PSU-1]KKF35038.1 transcriptional regulator [Erwinia tracheiphila]UIA86697.1 nuclear transport factor 2 family protein [Erwinia tracheiphila]UIA95053.1 nuclear transport factor 2 family protein [Erwinia tracheiphila]
MNQQATLNKLVSFYQSLDNVSLHQLVDIYHDDIVLVDPIAEHNGLQVVETYFALLLKNLHYCRFEVNECHLYNGTALLIWQMIYAHPALQRGKALQVAGSSHLRFGGDKIIFQRDYYDMGAMLYEKIPVLSAVIRQLKKRLRP